MLYVFKKSGTFQDSIHLILKIFTPRCTIWDSKVFLREGTLEESSENKA